MDLGVEILDLAEVRVHRRNIGRDRGIGVLAQRRCHVGQPVEKECHIPGRVDRRSLPRRGLRRLGQFAQPRLEVLDPAKQAVLARRFAQGLANAPQTFGQDRGPRRIAVGLAARGRVFRRHGALDGRDPDPGALAVQSDRGYVYDLPAVAVGEGVGEIVRCRFGHLARDPQAAEGMGE